MRQSQLFTKILREAPKDEEAINAKLLIRAGFVDKLMAGVYTYLPLGFRVIKKIENVIREEMNAIGGEELFMPTMQPKENWEKTGRWKTMDDLYKVKDASNREMALGPTHEEVIVPLVKKHVQSYKDLPLYVYQFQNKFRMELRVKSGLLRGREFMMKDFYSFHLDENDLNVYYEKVKASYFKIFKKLGLDKETYLTFASGSSFAKYSHEFQTISSSGEDLIYICKKCSLAINKEIKPECDKCPECGGKDFREEKAVEVGNIFKLGTRYSEPFGLKVKDEKGKERTVMMGCYGIGVSRLMGTIVETCHDEKGIIWPETVAPFKIHLIKIKTKIADKMYNDLQKAGVDVLYDDRDDKTPGEKFAEADLIGLPYRVVISERSLSKKSAEVKKRKENKISMVQLDLVTILNIISK